MQAACRKLRWNVCILVCLGLLTGAAPAIADDAAVDDRFTEEDREYWALQPIERPPVPEVAGKAPDNPIDAFLETRLAVAGIEPVGEADKRTLLRRATFDLHGLPPTPEQVEEFLADDRPDAWAKLIDRLLDSPRYGERYGRHWLDLVRYADSDGFKQDAYRPHAWRYRDWVIRALNEDKPYDEFVREQLAGDEIAPNDPDALVATGFLRHWPYEFNQRDVWQQRTNILQDLTEVTGSVFLGLSFNCAQCHDHKFDPILQEDYYRLQAFFAPLLPSEELMLGTAEEKSAYRERMAQWKEATAELREQLAELEEEPRRKVTAPDREKFPQEIQELLDKPREELTPYEVILVDLAERQLNVDAAALGKRMKDEIKERWQELRSEMEQFADMRPDPLPSVMGAVDVGPEAPPTYVPGYEYEGPIEPGFLSILEPKPAQIATASARERTTGRRTALAEWITSPENPLTTRVIVNRLWQYHFGVGLAESASDFGRQGEPPTHPKLLDWLAGELVRRDWSLKEMHRLMMSSRAYRRASLVERSHPGLQADPDNELWWRRKPLRLDAEQLRDATLAASGELDLRMGGPGAKDSAPRRSVYLKVQRNARTELLETFDAPDTHDSCARRSVTTTAPQALMLLNGEWAFARAKKFAGRVLKGEATEPEALVRRAYRLALAREPDEQELQAAVGFLQVQRDVITRRLEQDGKAAAPSHLPKDYGQAAGAAMVDLCHVLLNSNEFVYVD